MTSKLGDFVRDLREQQGLTRGQLVARIGYKNLNKGCRVLVQLEREGTAYPGFVEKVLNLLRADPDRVAALAREDQEAWRQAFWKWVNEPEEPAFWPRLPGFIPCRVGIPAELTTHEAIEGFACRWARERRLAGWLCFNRRHSAWISAEGVVTGRREATPENPSVRPVLTVGGRAIPFPLFERRG